MAANNRNRISPSGRPAFRQFETNVAPTVNDDRDGGFLVFSEWLDTTTNTTYKSIDDTPGAAVWVATSGAGVSLAKSGARGYLAAGALAIAAPATPLPVPLVIAANPAPVNFAQVGDNLIYTGPTKKFLVNASVGVLNGTDATALVVTASLVTVGAAAQAAAASSFTGVTNAIGGLCSFSTIITLATAQGVGLQIANITSDDDIAFTDAQLTITEL